MGSRLLWRRSATAVGLYSSMVFGILGTVIAARSFSLVEFGLYATVMAATGFFQSLLDLTVEESLTKYGFRYVTAEDWGRLRRLFRRALELKLAGGVLAGLVLVAFAPLAEVVFDSNELRNPLLLAALVPLLQSPENVATTALLLRRRYDLRALFQVVSMGLRLAGVAIGAQYGVAEAIAGIVVAQAIATVAVGLAGRIAFRRFPHAPAESLAGDAPGIRAFLLQSSLATGLISVRNALAPLLLGVVSGTTQVGLFRLAQAPQTGFSSLSSPIRLILLTEQTRDWERVMLLAASAQLIVGWSKSFPISIGRPNLRLATHGLETLVLLPLVIVLGSRWQATGAAIAVLVASVVFALHWWVLFVRIVRSHAPIGAAEPGAA
jgi:O-antigen/teichoic acid export membrane protein